MADGSHLLGQGIVRPARCGGRRTVRAGRRRRVHPHGRMARAVRARRCTASVDSMTVTATGTPESTGGTESEILDVDLLAFEQGSGAQRRAVVDGVTRSLATGFVY